MVKGQTNHFYDLSSLQKPTAYGRGLYEGSWTVKQPTLLGVRERSIDQALDDLCTSTSIEIVGEGLIGSCSWAIRIVNVIYKGFQVF